MFRGLRRRCFTILLGLLFLLDLDNELVPPSSITRSSVETRSALVHKILQRGALDQGDWCLMRTYPCRFKLTFCLDPLLLCRPLIEHLIFCDVRQPIHGRVVCVRTYRSRCPFDFLRICQPSAARLIPKAWLIDAVFEHPQPARRREISTLTCWLS